MPATSTRAEARARVTRLRTLPVDQEREAASLKGLTIEGRKLNLVVGNRLLSARLRQGIDGPSTVTIDLWDGDRRVLTAGALGLRVMSRVARVGLDGITYSIVGVARTGDVLTLTAENQIVQGLKRHGKGKPRRFSRGTYTRAQACASMIREAGYPVIVLDEDRVQPIAGLRKLRDELQRARADLAEQEERSAPSSRTTARGLTGTFTIKGETPSSHQRRNVAIALRVAAEERATIRPTLALLVAGIGESDFKDQPNAAGSPYGGVWQARKDRNLSTERQAYYFLRGGQGFQQGGAIKLARENPGMSPGEIATRVEASGEPGSFYDAHRFEADVIYTLRNESVVDAGTGGAAWVREYVFERRKEESTYTAVRRLLDEVRWRLFVREGVFVIASDPALMRAAASLQLRSGDPAVGDIDFEWHTSLRENEVTVPVYARRYQADPGEVAIVEDLTDVESRWLIGSVDIDLVDDAAPTQLGLVQPQRPAKEPSSEVRTSSGDRGTDPSSSDLRARIVAEARKTLTSRTGHRYYLAGGNQTRLSDPLAKSPYRSDCSQWVHAVYLKAGAPSPGVVSGEQFRNGKPTTSPRPGDLVLDAPSGSRHVELYVGDGKTIGHGTAPIDEWTVDGMRSYFGDVVFVTFDFLDKD